MPNSPETWPAEAPFDKQAVRRDFGRAAPGYDRHAGLQRQVAGRVADLFAEQKSPSAGTVLDVGAGTGAVGAALAERGIEPERLVALDLAHPMTQQGRRAGGPGVTADAEALPFAPAAFDAVLSSLTLQWVNDLEDCLRGMARVLRPGGILVASTVVRGTLDELAAALRAVDGTAGVGPFLPRERLAAALAGSGLAAPRCRVERLVRTAPDPAAVLRDLKGLGAVDKAPDRARGLRGRRRLIRLCRAYREAAGTPEGPVPVTWQIGYLVAWKRD